jgi:uncharacterized membrane protein YeaQ/YmgE (transglycosylase-associated protein family)
MNITAWIIFGIVIGILTTLLDPEPKKGNVLGGIILGVSGAFVGGVMATLIFGETQGFTSNIATFITAFIGALSLLLISRVFRESEL